ncbi:MULTISPECIES: hypothetical protein [unclassified Streptomyces]|uniref:hypothetical protein n=1 Tax=unclassified Streptomyces TaxID=2593676 RepID=UPI0035DAC552
MTRDPVLERAELEQIFADLYAPVVRYLVSRTEDRDVSVDLARRVFVQAGETVSERPAGQTEIAWVWDLTRRVLTTHLGESHGERA